MRISKLMFVCVCLIGLTQIGWSQNQHLGKQPRGIPGYLDPRSGTFTTRAQSAGTNSEGAQANPALTTILARLIFNFTILNDQPANAVISCTVALSTLDDSSGLFYDESATSIATNSGTACTVTILFSWALASPTTDTISVDYHISSFRGTPEGPEAVRTADHSIASIPVPMNGQTITEPTISTTI